MKFIKATMTLVLICFSTSMHAATQPSNGSLSNMLEKVIPAVVNIQAEGKLPPTVYLKKHDDDDPTNQMQLQQQRPVSKPFVSLGSGVIINASHGTIITNAHVVKDADRITVKLIDGRQFKAKIIGADAPSDIAVLQIQGPHLTALSLSDSNQLKVGDQVVAIGNPFGLGQSVTAGIVSALQRTNLNIEGYENFIQIDAPINFGNSGGALVTHNGKLVGMNTAMLSDTGGNIGIGFSIPANMLNNVVKQLLKYGKVERGVVGVMVQTLTPDLATALQQPKQKGAVVTQLAPNSPAKKAGIQTGDIITAVNGTEISTSAQLVNSVGFMRTGSTVSLQVLRHGKPMTFKPKIITIKSLTALSQKDNPYFFGVGLQNFNQYSATQGNVNGVLVIGVLPDSNAWSAGLRPGDVIISANQSSTKDTNTLEKIAHNNHSESLLLNVIRGHGAIFIAIPKGVTNV
ncbi:MAG: Do family serine endopeptidase [Gammaproteobacteria bacterium]